MSEKERLNKSESENVALGSTLITIVVGVWGYGVFLAYVPQGWWTIPALVTIAIFLLFLFCSVCHTLAKWFYPDKSPFPQE